MPTFEERNENSDMEVSSHLSHVKSSQNSADHETVAAIQPADVLEQFSGTSLRYKCLVCVPSQKKNIKLHSQIILKQVNFQAMT